MNDQHQLSVSWNQYVKNVCNGLWSLQQHGEFVDMTLAADGHHVKVHKMLLSLASPYIKELIMTADCAHPVIFLNQVNYTTLCLLLEYIYTGEVVVPREHFKAFMQTGQALHIKGLQVKGLEQSDYYGDVFLSRNEPSPTKSAYSGNRSRQMSECSSEKSEKYIGVDYLESTDVLEDSHDTNREDSYKQNEEGTIMAESSEEDTKPFEPPRISVKKRDDTNSRTSTAIQYSISNQGNLQLVMNRYLYNVRYVSRKANQLKWQCIDGHWKGLRCPAHVVTLDNMVVRRNGVHNHPFHDKKILKKIQNGLIFSGVKEAQKKVESVKVKKKRGGEIEGNEELTIKV